MRAWRKSFSKTMFPAPKEDEFTVKVLAPGVSFLEEKNGELWTVSPQIIYTPSNSTGFKEQFTISWSKPDFSKGKVVGWKKIYDHFDDQSYI